MIRSEQLRQPVEPLVWPARRVNTRQTDWPLSPGRIPSIASTLLEVSPFYHYNQANYESNPNDFPVATTSDRASNYGGAQANITTNIARNTIQAGFTAGVSTTAMSLARSSTMAASPTSAIRDSAAGGLIEEYVSDNFKATPVAHADCGLRQTQLHRPAFTENEIDPRVGVGHCEIPKLTLGVPGILRTLLSAAAAAHRIGPVVDYANANNTSFVPLHGERDEEHQFGVQIPFKGWLLDADTFKNRINNFLDHSNIGDSSIYYPVTVDGALIRAWELTLRSPRIWQLRCRLISPIPIRLRSSAETSPVAWSAFRSVRRPAMLALTTVRSTTISATR